MNKGKYTTQYFSFIKKEQSVLLYALPNEKIAKIFYNRQNRLTKIFSAQKLLTIFENTL